MIFSCLEQKNGKLFGGLKKYSYLCTRSAE